MNKPKIIAVHDRGEGVFDRYTVFFDTPYNSIGTFNDCLVMSENPSHSLGFSVFTGWKLGDNEICGKQIKFTDLPQHIQDHVSLKSCH